MRLPSSKNRFGFTIVELLVVIVVVGILAAVSLISFTGISQKASRSVLDSNLTNAAKQMQLSFSSSDLMPNIIPSSFKNSDGIVLSLSSTGNNSTYCINAKKPSDNIYMYYLSTNGKSMNGNCSGSVISGSEIGINKNLAVDDSFSVIGGSDWRISLSDPLGVTLSRRTGLSSDPIENKPVLVLTNNTSKTENWSVLNGRISYADIVAGASYSYSLWIRRQGVGYAGTVNLSVRDGNGLNGSLSFSGSPAITDSWQKITGVATASQNGFATNLFYLGVNTSSFLNTGWSLEFQEPQITRL